MPSQTLRAQYYHFMSDLKYQVIVCEVYEAHAKCLQSVLTFFSLALTSAAIVNLDIWEFFPAASMAFAVATQLLICFKSVVPLASRLAAIRFYLPRLRSFVVTCEKHWNTADAMEDDELIAMLVDDKAVAANLENEFIGDNHISVPRYCNRKVNAAHSVAMKPFDANAK